MFKPIMLQPLADDLQPAGEPIQALSRDVTISGIGWISTVPVSDQYLSIDLFPDTHESRCVIVRVAHQLQSGPLYLGGGAVVVDWQ
ncbi:hypothetical protein [Stieleria varia]|uniref:hypothetical protein n=1 Tax=Stieleria varia TaxID=2528005 RepID=UPI0011B3BF99|nr:hypothetical protein [Stieleria varia]